MATFPSLAPRLSDELWFSLDKRLDDDAALTKEEKEHTASLQKVVNQGYNITPIGKKKEEQEQIRDQEDEDEIEDDEDTGEDMEDDTDEYESASPDAESEVEMLDLTREV